MKIMRNLNTNKKPVALLRDGANVYTMLNVCSKVLVNAGRNDDARNMVAEVAKAGNPDAARGVMERYVNVFKS